jgi:hypothetical protein
MEEAFPSLLYKQHSRVNSPQTSPVLNRQLPHLFLSEIQFVCAWTQDVFHVYTNLFHLNLINLITELSIACSQQTNPTALKCLKSRCCFLETEENEGPLHWTRTRKVNQNGHGSMRPDTMPLPRDSGIISLPSFEYPKLR